MKTDYSFNKVIALCVPGMASFTPQFFLFSLLKTTAKTPSKFIKQVFHFESFELYTKWGEFALQWTCTKCLGERCVLKLTLCTIQSQKFKSQFPPTDIIWPSINSYTIPNKINWMSLEMLSYTAQVHLKYLGLRIFSSIYTSSQALSSISPTYWALFLSINIWVFSNKNIN